MSSVQSHSIQNKIKPLNLTSQAVHKILKQNPIKLPSYKKIYPTAKYETEKIRVTSEIDIGKKIKQLDKIHSQSTHKKNKKQKYKTQGQNYQQTNQQTVKNPKMYQNTQKLQSTMIQSNSYKKYDKDPSMWKRSTQKYLQKVSKIKNLKLRQYMKNRFAIDTKTIDSTRDNFRQKLQIGHSTSNQLFNDKVAIQKQQTSYRPEYQLFKLLKSRMNTEQNKTKKRNQYNNTSYQQKNNSSEQKQRDNQHNQSAQKPAQKFDKTYKQKTFIVIKSDAEENPAHIRFQKMLNHLNLILLSFHCKHQFVGKQLPAYSRNCPKFKFYVGPGNNKNLIISVLKKRWWWTQTSSIAEADFAWTQLKQSKFLLNCQKIQKQKQLLSYEKNVEISKQNTQQLKNDKSKQQKHKLFHQKSNIKVQNIKDCFIGNKKKLKLINVPKRFHNHYQGNSNIGNKKALFHFISLFCSYKNIDRYDYIPLTFHIASPRSSQIKNLQKAFQTFPQSYWILKPGQNSNRGNGISLTNSLTEIKQKIKNLTSSTLIVQKYIQNLFLYNGRKFDIRTYMIAVTIGGSTKFYWHGQGYLRTSSYLYNLKQPDDIFVHLTNDAIQCESQHYSKFQDGNKVSYKQFQRYLDDKQNNKKKNKFLIKQAHQQMKKIAKLAVCATQPLLNSSKLEFAFQVFGLDFILDSNFRPWLIQINTNPCLELSSSCLARLIPQMIQNTFRIAVDPVFQPCVDFPRMMSSCVPNNILLTNRFSLIYDDLYDNDQEWVKRLQAEPQKTYQGEQEQFEGDGEIIQL